MNEQTTIYPSLDGEIGISRWTSLARLRLKDENGNLAATWLDDTCVKWLIAALQDALKDMN
jgi:hypothetical protein